MLFGLVDVSKSISTWYKIDPHCTHFNSPIMIQFHWCSVGLDNIELGVGDWEHTLHPQRCSSGNDDKLSTFSRSHLGSWFLLAWGMCIMPASICRSVKWVKMALGHPTWTLSQTRLFQTSRLQWYYRLSTHIAPPSWDVVRWFCVRITVSEVARTNFPTHHSTVATRRLMQQWLHNLPNAHWSK